MVCRAAFEDFNRRARHPHGFRIAQPARERVFQTPSGLAEFSQSVLPDDVDPGEGRLLLTTVRSHVQFNTTIYFNHDRYRGLKGLPIAGTSFTAGYLAYGEFYDFRVTAVNRSGESPASNIVTLLAGNPYTIANVSCRSYYIKVPLPGGGSVTTDWVEVRAHAWGVSRAPNVSLTIHRVNKNDALWVSQETRLWTSSFGQGSTDNPMHEAALGGQRFDLYVQVRGPNGEYWGGAHDRCYGA